MKKIDVIIVNDPPVEYGILLADGGEVREPNGSIKVYPYVGTGV